MQKLVQNQSEKIKLFEESIKSPYTRKVYTTCLKKYFQFPGSSKVIDSTDSRKIEDHITDFITSMKKQGKSFGAIHNYVAAVCKYYRRNRVTLDTRHIHEYLPDRGNQKRIGHIHISEIQSLLDISDDRFRAIILLLASTGMRIGAIPEIRLRNIEKISIDSVITVHKITVYEGFKEEYTTFTHLNVTLAIDNYLKMRERYGEKLNPNSYLNQRTI